MTFWTRLACCSVSAATAVTVWGALDIVFDYTYDSANFFSGVNAGRRQVLDAAAAVFESRLTLENFGAIAPGGGNTWSLSFQNPTTGTEVTINDPLVPANQIRIYVGARDLSGTLIGNAQFNYSYNGNAAWVSLFQGRDSTNNFDSFGGAIAFDSAAPFYFDSNPATLESFPGKYDFFSLALHEVGHLLGFTDGARAFAARVSGNNFTGAKAVSLFGGPVPLLISDFDHWAQSVSYGGQVASMVPTSFFNERRLFTELDFAALKDIGYNVNNVPEPCTLVLFGFGALAAARRRSNRAAGNSGKLRFSARNESPRSARARAR